MSSILIKNARLKEMSDLQDIFIDNGIFQKIENSSKNIQADTEIDAEGGLVSPPFVDPHVHLDAVLSSGKLARQNQSGTLLEAIDIWGEWKADLTIDMLKENAREVIKWYIANGVLHIRTHADCTDPTLLTVKSLIELRDELREYVDIQVVAFPQDGIFSNRENEALLKESIAMGVDVVGGAPHIELTREDGVADVKLVYDLAEKHDKLIDIHIDETGDPHSRFVEIMAREAIFRGMGDRSAASHTTAMHNYNNDYAFKVIANIKKAGLNMITNPFDNSVLQNRTDGYPRKRGHTRVDELLAAGVNVSIGHDSIMDPWYSMGRGSMLQAANLLMHTAHMNGASQIPQLFDMITINSAKLMKLENYGISPGKQADLIILDAKDAEEAIRLNSECLYVIRKGKVICESVPAKRKLYMNGKEESVDFKL